MAFTEPQQILETIKRSKRPIILVPTPHTVDTLAAALGLAHVLRKLEKSVEIVHADGPLPKNLAFLPGSAQILSEAPNLRKFLIELDLGAAKVDELTYDVKNGKLVIELKPRGGFWKAEDVKTNATAYTHDLIICAGAPDLKACGAVYAAHPDFFFAVPVLNIDNNPANEHFGTFNAVDITASAVSEVCFDLVERLDALLIDAPAATCFLTGMIAKTKSFKSTRVTPKTLQTASKLVKLDARHSEIVDQLYRTRSIETLRLWGRALARLKSDPEVRLAWTLLSQQDFMNAGADEHDLPDVVDELIQSSPAARIVVLLYEDAEHHVNGVIRCQRPHDALILGLPFKAAGTREEAHLGFKDKTLLQAEKAVTEHVRKALRETRDTE